MGIPEITESEMAALRDQARVGGLRFEAYLPPRLADWLLDHIERRTFRDPSEAVFVLFGEQQELEPQGDLRHEILRRRLQAGIDSGSNVSGELLAHPTELPPSAVWPRK